MLLNWTPLQPRPIIMRSARSYGWQSDCNPDRDPDRRLAIVSFMLSEVTQRSSVTPHRRLAGALSSVAYATHCSMLIPCHFLWPLDTGPVFRGRCTL